MSDATADDRLSGSLDAVLHLLDRQVVDAQGRLVCNVDDLELTEIPDGVLAVTALLAGPAALVPRFGDGRLGRRLLEYWHQLGLPQADRDDPYRLDLALVARVGSGVELKVARDGVLVRQGQRGRRLNELLQMPVQDPAGVTIGRVLDVRLAREQVDPGDRIRVVGLVVGQGRPGSWFGYDRRPQMGPWLVNRIVRWLHRHSAYAAIEDLDALDWNAGVIRVDRSRLRALEAA